jgi:hypothetical protein
VSAGAVLIAPAEHLPALKQVTQDAGEVLAFADTEALRALDAITRQRPAVIALERMFASTSRGAALINRIKADPALSACEIRIVAHDAVPVPASPARPAAATAVAVEERPAPPLDQRGTRRAARVRITDGVDISVDGSSARLVDLSIVGAQVVSPVILKPNQRVRVSLPDAPRPIRMSAAVAWAFFEMPKGTPAPQYRAGIEFFDADAAAVQKFIETKKK